MALDVRPMQRTGNDAILNAIRNEASSDYQRRIPAATKANLDSVARNLWNYSPSRNEFIDAFVNRIGLVLFQNEVWSNPLSKFKRGMLEFGDTIEEIQLGLAQGYTYEPDRDYLEQTLFGQERPEAQSSFHKINRQQMYKITVNTAMLRRAIIDDGQLAQFAADLMSVPTTSDNWDEFLITASLFKRYDELDGFFYVNIPDLTTPDAATAEANAKAALRAMRAKADTLPFVSRHYNAAKMPIHTTPDKLELFITPEANATIDVDALAAAFNEDKAKFAARTTIIPAEYMPDGVQAILTTRDFFVIADTLFETASQPNPAGLYTNYFLHHHSIVSFSRFVPAIAFTTNAGTVIQLDATPVTGIEGFAVMDETTNTSVTNVERGHYYRITGDAVTTPDGGLNDALRFELVGALSDRTYLWQTGSLHVSLDEAADTLTINAIALDDDTIRETLTVTVVGDRVVVNGVGMTVEEDADSDGLPEVTPEAPAFDTTTDTVTIPTVTGVQYLKAGVNVNNGSTHVITASTVFTAVARAGYELTTGATASWTYTP